MSHRIYRGTKVYLIRSPCPCLCRGPPSGHEIPLGYFDRVIFKLQDFRVIFKLQDLFAGQTGKSKGIDKKLIGALRQGGCSWTYLNVFPMTLATGGSGGKAFEREMPSPT
jgi:hypothetical protein